MQTKQLRVLSYNIYIRPFVYSNNGDFKEERLNSFIETVLPNYDVITLQEIFAMGWTNRKKKLIHEAKSQGFEYHTTVHGSWTKPIDSGLLILSRYPILDTDSIVFSEGMNIDGWSTKGVLSALIEYNNSKILVITTHTQAEYDSTNPKYFEIQQHQLQELSEFVKKKHLDNPEVPILLTGDFNVNSRVTPDSDGKEHSKNYQKTMEILNFEANDRQAEWIDLLYQKQGHHPVTFADTVLDESTQKHVPRDIVLTHPVTLGSRQRLDYAFFLQDKNTSVEEAQVEPLFIQGKTFGQLSDHYGVSVVLKI
jgi:endonuclease/exonuclease/phosphatase family metal-dependent hydrolase